MKIFRKIRLSSRIFIIIALLILLPFTIMLQYVKSDMENLLRDEISNKVVQNLSKSENEISQLLGRMISISNIFFRDPDFAKTFSDNSVSYYDRTVVFNKIIGEISMQNLYDYFLDYVDITFFDNNKDVYASWSLNYSKCAWLLEQDWVQESLRAKGYIIWNMSSEGFDDIDDQGKDHQISLARSIINDDHSYNSLGTILISVDHRHVLDILNKYKHSELDSILAFSQEGEVLLNNGDFLPEDQMNDLIKEYEKVEKGNEVITLNKRKYLLSYYTINLSSIYSQKQLKIFYFTDYQHIDNQIAGLLVKINTISILVVIVLFLIAILIARGIAGPISVLSDQMKSYRVGQKPHALEIGRTDEIGEIYASFYNMSIHINDLFEKLRQEQKIKEKYQYESLRSKMSPHFLFNTLNTIRWMAIIRKADNIRESIDSLAEILKYSMTKNDEMVELMKEIEIIKSYCHIQNMRFGNTYSLTVDLDDDVRYCQIIKFIFQPVVENIFKHAFAADSRGGLISISGHIDNGRLRVSIQDNGKGFSQESMDKFYRRRAGSMNEREHLGIGLDIIEERIRISFGSEYGIELSNVESGGARVDYYLPVIKNNGPEEEVPC